MGRHVLSRAHLRPSGIARTPTAVSEAQLPAEKAEGPSEGWAWDRYSFPPGLQAHLLLQLAKPTSLLLFLRDAPRLPHLFSGAPLSLVRLSLPFPQPARDSLPALHGARLAPQCRSSSLRLVMRELGGTQGLLHHRSIYDWADGGR